MFYLQHTLSRTQAAQNESTVSASQSVTSVNFSLYSPQKPSTNQNTLVENPSNQSTPPRQQLARPTNQSTPPRQPSDRPANQNSPSTLSASELSPVQRQPMGHEHLFSPGRESMVSHSTEKDHEEVAIENAALTHLKQFQEYMNKYVNNLSLLVVFKCLLKA